jgi:hypothetical protein
MVPPLKFSSWMSLLLLTKDIAFDETLFHTWQKACGDLTTLN